VFSVQCSVFSVQCSVVTVQNNQDNQYKLKTEN
jgi:hypothetical protein